MNFLIKIENAINALLLLIGGLFTKFMAKLIPPKVRALAIRIWEKILRLIAVFKSLPQTAKPWVMATVIAVKSKLKTYDYKTKLKSAYDTSVAKYKGQGQSKFNKYKTICMTPFVILGSWLQGLSAVQSLILLGLTAASILSGVNMVFSGKRMVDSHFDAGREPASEEGPTYDRPDYYKKQLRHLDLTNLRLPVFVPEVNDQRTVDVDFTATTSNRATRRFLEKHEFELRDHFVLNIEPVQASFPIVEEGREIIRQKLLLEINEFLRDNGVDGHVTDLKLTYVLAN